MGTISASLRLVALGLEEDQTEPTMRPGLTSDPCAFSAVGVRCMRRRYLDAAQRLPASRRSNSPKESRPSRGVAMRSRAQV